MAKERLQKYLAAAGIGSRRACERIIANGRVQVNGHTITELGTKIDPTIEHVSVDGKPVKIAKRRMYIKLHKPRGILSDIGGDNRGRRCVADLLPREARRVYPVGRLDLNSEGLMLLTDDGNLAHKLTHPRFSHTKTYYALVEQLPGEKALNQLRTGINLPDGRTAPAHVQVVQKLPEGLLPARGTTSGVWLEMGLREGKKRQIRHMTAAVGHPTLRLIRWSIGTLTLVGLHVNQSEFLSRREVGDLMRLINQSQKTGYPKPRSRERWKRSGRFTASPRA